MDLDHVLYRAIVFAENAHRGQFRKGTEKPYFTHPVAVGMMVLSRGHGVEAAVVGLLHDVLEDTPVDRDEIDDAFGPAIAQAVVDLSELDKTLPWEARKTAYVEHLARATDLALPACAADKIHNLRSMLWDIEDARASGLDPNGVWRRFKRPPHKICAYHRAVHAALARRAFASPLQDALASAIDGFARIANTDPLGDEFSR